MLPGELADYTAGRELHPALKDVYEFALPYQSSLASQLGSDVGPEVGYFSGGT